MPNTIDIERLRSLIDYEPEPGVFRWKTKLSNRAGVFAGSRRPDGRLQIRIDTIDFLASRLAWALQTGAWPDREVEHRDLDRSNDRWANLRLATRGENFANRRKRSDSFQPFKGVARHHAGKWQARISVRGKRLYLGLFDTAEEAQSAYQAAATREYGEFARFG